MKTMPAIAVLLIFTGCAVTDQGHTLGKFNETAPGYPLYRDDGLVFAPCRKADEVGRCVDWKVQSDYCVNPKGHEAQPPIVKCSSIKRR